MQLSTILNKYVEFVLNFHSASTLWTSRQYQLHLLYVVYQCFTNIVQCKETDREQIGRCLPGVKSALSPLWDMYTCVHHARRVGTAACAESCIFTSRISSNTPLTGPGKHPLHTRLTQTQSGQYVSSSQLLVGGEKW